MGNKLKWCFKLKNGLRVIEPNERLSKSYIEQAKSSLLRAEKDFKDEDMLWATVAIYYSEYYALYSFLQRIGVKCENHSCSILAVGFLLGQEKIKTINEHKDKRVDAQYYMKIEQEDKIEAMLQEAKTFVSGFDELISNLSEKEVDAYRDNISKEKLNVPKPLFGKGKSKITEIRPLWTIIQSLLATSLLGSDFWDTRKNRKAIFCVPKIQKEFFRTRKR